MLKNQIAKLVNGIDLSREETENAFDKIMSGSVSDIQKSAFLTALSIKGETIDEITAAADTLRKFCTKVPHKCDSFEIVGTGGDKSNTFSYYSCRCRNTCFKTRQPCRFFKMRRYGCY